MKSLLGMLIIASMAAGLSGCNVNSGEHKPVTQARASGAAAASFAEVLPIFQTRCASCHNSGTNDWTKEQNVVRVARSGVLIEKVSTNQMPKPGSPEALAITAAERQRLIAWAKSVNQGPVTAAPVSDEDPDTVHDRNLSIVARCMTCHGSNGRSVGPDFPNLASHDGSYIVSRLTGFLAPDQTGTMPDMLKSIVKEHKLTFDVKNGAAVPSQDLADVFEFLAGYFSNQYVNPPASDFEKLQKSFSANQKSIYETGKKIVSEQCVFCHLQKNFRPGDGFPMVFGQKSNYLTARLEQFKKGTGGTIMPGVAAGLKDEDLPGIVFYLSNTHPTQGQPAK